MPTENQFKKGDSVSARKVQSTNGRISERHPVRPGDVYSGVLQQDIVVGGQIALSSVREWFYSSEVQAIDGNKVHTANSVYEITRR